MNDYLTQVRLLLVLAIFTLATGCTGRLYIGYDRTDAVKEHRQMNDHDRGER